MAGSDADRRERHGPLIIVGSSLNLTKPSSNHAADLVDLIDDKKQLLLADPTSIADQTPENPELFEVKVEPA